MDRVALCDDGIADDCDLIVGSPQALHTEQAGPFVEEAGQLRGEEFPLSCEEWRGGMGLEQDAVDSGRGRARTFRRLRLSDKTEQFLHPQVSGESLRGAD